MWRGPGQPERQPCSAVRSGGGGDRAAVGGDRFFDENAGSGVRHLHERFGRCGGRGDSDGVARPPVAGGVHGQSGGARFGPRSAVAASARAVRSASARCRDSRADSASARAATATQARAGRVEFAMAVLLAVADVLSGLRRSGRSRSALSRTVRSAGFSGDGGDSDYCRRCRDVVNVRPVSARHPSMRLLRYWIWRRPCRSAPMRWSGSVNAVLAWLLRRSSDQMP